MSEPASLYRMFYVSKATRQMTRGELEDLMLGAQKRNAERGVSGLLVYDAGNFAQVLEGPQNVVQELYWKIEKDPRHGHASILSQWPVDRRDFGGWAMGLENIDERREPDLEPLREIMRTRRVKDTGVAYRFLLAFRSAMRRP